MLHVPVRSVIITMLSFCYPSTVGGPAKKEKNHVSWSQIRLIKKHTRILLIHSGVLKARIQPARVLSRNLTGALTANMQLGKW